MCQRLLLPTIALLLAALLVQRVWQSAGLRERHEHSRGERGGVIVSLGGDRYHVEGVFTQEGSLKLYPLGRETDRVMEVPIQTLTAYITPHGEAQALSLRLEPEPQVGDTPGMTSCFAGRLPAALTGQTLEVRIPNFRIDGHRFHLAFVQGSADRIPAMPSGATGAEERELFLVPGGNYSQGDIVANGSTTPSLRFRGFQSRHDHNPKSGDPLCPVTRTKANPACTWIIDGQSYSFCCPPCIGEFVRLAKEQPDRLGPPESYAK
jgi:hypothetical protein